MLFRSEKWRNADNSYTDLCGDVATYDNQQKTTDKQRQADQVFGLIKRKFSDINKRRDDYLDKEVANTNSNSNTHLKKLSPPTFSGKKIDYVRFKFEFEQHVTYKDEKNKVLCLKEECLLKQEDKDKVANQYTMADCWDKLDAEHGGPTETVNEIFKS